MAKLGAPVTSKFPIGTAELRIGPLNKAGLLTQAHSVGLVDQASVEVAQESVDLPGGFPQTTVATAIVSQNSTITATLRESSRRNMKIMMGEGLDAVAPTDVESLVVTDVAADGTVFSVTASDGTNFTVGDIVALYIEGQPESVCLDRIASIAVDAITVDNGIPVAMDGTTETVKVYVANQVAIGGVTSTKYFAASLIQADNSTGRPIGYHTWKAANSGSMSYATNATDFASFELELKILAPSVADYTTGSLLHQANVIPANPSGYFFGGGD